MEAGFWPVIEVQHLRYNNNRWHGGLARTGGNDRITSCNSSGVMWVLELVASRDPPLGLPMGLQRCSVPVPVTVLDGDPFFLAQVIDLLCT